MLKLYIDDVRPCPDGWHDCRTVAEAIRTIATMGEQVSEISLDFDDGTVNTFEPVAWFITNFYPLYYMSFNAYGDQKEMPKPKITIHTSNPGGAKKLAEILEGFELSRSIAE